MPTKPFCVKIESYSKSLHTKMKIEKKSINTIKAYMRTYRDFVEFCNQHYKELSFQNIKEEDIYAFIEYKSETMQKQGDISISTTNSIISNLKRLFKHIERNSDEPYDFDKVFEDIKLKQPKRKPKGLSDSDVSKIIDHLERMKKNEIFLVYRNILLFKLMLYAGLRASEAVSVTLSNIVLDGESGLYKLTFKGKGDKNRFSFIREDVIDDEINMLINVFKVNPENVIATTSSSNQMDRIQLSKMVNSIYRSAGVEITGVHILRHTAAKKLLASGVSIVVVQSLLGHSSIQTTSIYANPTEDIVKKELAAMIK
jgi:integrase/recombinase XerD